MRILLIAVGVALSAPAFAQVHVQVQLPSIVFPTPPHLVIAAPGVEVVEDYDDEVFFADNYYWHRRGPSWFRTRTHTGGWEVVEPRFVPRAIAATPEGTYRRWHRVAHEERHEKHEEHGNGKGKATRH